MDTILTKQECVTILKQVKNNAEFEDFKISSASKDILGFLGEYFKLIIYTKDVSFQCIMIYLLYIIHIYNIFQIFQIQLTE